MIDEKKIKEAAGEWAAEHPSPRPNVYEDKKEGFVQGAEWAQEEFVKNLWHDASEKAKPNKDVVAITKYGTDTFKSSDDFDWEYTAHFYRVVRWAYLDDILPKEL